RLSAERISKELLKLLQADDPRAAVGLMREAGVLPIILPGDLDYARFAEMCAIDADPELRLSALLPDDSDAVAATAERLRLSNAQRDRLVCAAEAEPSVTLDMDPREARGAIYRLGARAFDDRVKRAWAAAPEHSEAARRLLQLAGSWTAPKFPLGGAEAMAAGLSGPAVGKALKAVEDWWVAEDFPAGGALQKLHEVAGEGT
ncbi:MAG TPA: CCA tRNA nucleotidyltransferase, partial [Reyranella sp.]|nr:CCA tRNA nucleotidyltransferase [Reyranella sp.]